MSDLYFEDGQVKRREPSWHWVTAFILIASAAVALDVLVFGAAW